MESPVSQLTKDFIFTVNGLLMKGVYKNQKELTAALEWVESAMSAVLNEKRDVPAQVAYRLFRLLVHRNLIKEYEMFVSHYKQDLQLQSTIDISFLELMQWALNRGYFKDYEDIAQALEMSPTTMTAITDKEPNKEYSVPPNAIKKYELLLQDIIVSKKEEIERDKNQAMLLKRLSDLEYQIEALKRILIGEVAEIKNFINKAGEGKIAVEIMSEIDKAYNVMLMNASNILDNRKITYRIDESKELKYLNKDPDRLPVEKDHTIQTINTFEQNERDTEGDTPDQKPDEKPKK